MRESLKRRKNLLEMFGNEHIIKRLHFLSYKKKTYDSGIGIDFRFPTLFVTLEIETSSK